MSHPHTACANYRCDHDEPAIQISPQSAARYCGLTAVAMALTLIGVAWSRGEPMRAVYPVLAAGAAVLVIACMLASLRTGLHAVRDHLGQLDANVGQLTEKVPDLAAAVDGLQRSLEQWATQEGDPELPADVAPVKEAFAHGYALCLTHTRPGADGGIPLRLAASRRS